MINLDIAISVDPRRGEHDQHGHTADIQRTYRHTGTI